MKPREFTEFHRRIAFVDKGRVVLEEEYPTNVERPVNGEVIFDTPDTTTYKSYSCDAGFRVSKVAFGDELYYLLVQIKSD